VHALESRSSCFVGRASVGPLIRPWAVTASARPRPAIAENVARRAPEPRPRARYVVRPSLGQTDSRSDSRVTRGRARQTVRQSDSRVTRRCAGAAGRNLPRWQQAIRVSAALPSSTDPGPTSMSGFPDSPPPGGHRRTKSAGRGHPPCSWYLCCIATSEQEMPMTNKVAFNP
jgi:hypothetical protein